MCIRDRSIWDQAGRQNRDSEHFRGYRTGTGGQSGTRADACLLYTSDAADERSSVDLGGRRIIKKKKKQDTDGHRTLETEKMR